MTPSVYLGVMKEKPEDVPVQDKPPRARVEPAVLIKSLTEDLNFIRSYFMAMQPAADIERFRGLFKSDAVVTPEMLKSWCSTAAALPSVLLSTPGLIDVMAFHIAGCWNNDVPNEVVEAVQKLKPN